MEYQFRCKDVKRPIFLKADSEADALAQLAMIGYVIDDSPIVEEIKIELPAQETIKVEAPLTPKPTKKSTVNVKPPTVCDCCDNEQDPLKELEYFGRKLLLCDTCYAKEKPATVKPLETTYGLNLQDKIEKIVAKTVDVSQEKWQVLYNEERPNWVVSNFESMMDMRDKLVSFIVELESMQFATKAKMRVAYDASRELEAKLSKAEREALIFDPNFKVPENSQHKKVRMTKEEKNRLALIEMGMSEEDIKKFLEGV